MCALPTDLDPPEDQDVSNSTVQRLAALLGIKASTFTDQPHLFSADGSELDAQEPEPDLQAALSRIEDEEIRVHMERLLTSLEMLKADI